MEIIQLQIVNIQVGLERQEVTDLAVKLTEVGKMVEEIQQSDLIRTCLSIIYCIITSKTLKRLTIEA